ncbi:MAG: SpoIIE family protein phosphatase [Candidatus Omnitrophica bacterium]|nr:SpoIIE family protein phosphatase [Candidatus Omnitrophota bacterium]
MPYFHIDTEAYQESKRIGAPCGDTFLVRRSVYHTTIILADGIGSGIKAHIASQMSVSRLAQLLEGGASLRDAFFNVVGTMSKWRDHTMPFSAFLLMRVLNDGTTTILSYEMPASLLISRREVNVIGADPLVVPAGIASESHFHLLPSEGVLLISDGIVQAGMGKNFHLGWGVEGVETFLSSCVGKDIDFHRVAQGVIEQANYHDGAHSGDDKTVLLVHGRAGLVVDVLTGPPADSGRDGVVADGFWAAKGFKVICGATTADIMARYAGRKVEVEQKPVSFSTPPRYFIQGVDMVTEGAITLMQAYNIIEEEGIIAKDRSAAGDLVSLLQHADFVRFTVGLARNPANSDIVYRKQGILPRDKIVPLLAQKLERMGKLVTVTFV